MKPLFICYDRCGTCRKAAGWLAGRGIEVVKRDIVKDPPSVEELAEWSLRANRPLSRMFNTSGILYRELHLKERIKEAGEAELLKLLSSEGMLVKRPILVTDRGVVFGFREEEWDALFPESRA